MDPLKPIFKAHGWDLKKSSPSHLVYRKHDGVFVTGAEVMASQFKEGDLFLVVSLGLAHTLTRTVSETIVRNRLAWFVTAVQDDCSTQPLVKRATAAWDSENSRAVVALEQYWLGHGSMLAAPYELYVAAVGLSYEFQKHYLEKIQTGLGGLLMKPEEDAWANSYEAYEVLVLTGTSTCPANLNQSV